MSNNITNNNQNNNPPPPKEDNAIKSVLSVMVVLFVAILALVITASVQFKSDLQTDHSRTTLQSQSVHTTIGTKPVKPVEPSKPDEDLLILERYNAAIDKAVNAKVGYQKTRFTDNEKMEGSAGLQAMKTLVYQFLGIGAENAYNETVEKGKWGDVAFLTNSRLVADDVTSATCAEEGSNYVITLTLKSGNSIATLSSHSTPANSALDKCGICVGSEDKGYFDHRTASVIYDAIAGTFASAEVRESYTNAKVVATVDSTTGNLISLVVEWNESVILSKLLDMSATVSGVCHVTYNNFKW